MGIFQPAMLYDQRVHKWGYKVIYNPYGLFDPTHLFQAICIWGLSLTSPFKKKDGPMVPLCSRYLPSLEELKRPRFDQLPTPIANSKPRRLGRHMTLGWCLWHHSIQRFSMVIFADYFCQIEFWHVKNVCLHRFFRLLLWRTVFFFWHVRICLIICSCCNLSKVLIAILKTFFCREMFGSWWSCHMTTLSPLMEKTPWFLLGL